MRPIHFWASAGLWLVGVLSVAAADLPQAQLDPALTSREKESVTKSFDSLASFPLNGVGVPFFEESFGGTTGSDVLRYTDERIEWIVSPKANLERDVIPLNMGQVRENEDEEEPLIVAVNIGTAIWFASLERGLPGLSLLVGNNVVPITSSRAGVIQIGKDFPDLRLLIRDATLVHEARHSDCTGGLSAKDLERLRSGELLFNNPCGHTHALCPAGHDLEGLPGCDEHPWGAYAIEYQYLLAHAQSCDTCSERDISLSIVLRVDTASRVLGLRDMLDGKFGPPDMTSVDVSA